MKAVIYDMDGILIDSEPLWRKAEKIEFKKVGITLTDEMLADTVGLRIDEVVHLWFRRFPWEGPTEKEVLDNILERMVNLISTEGKALPGVYETLAFFKEKGLPIGLATSSPTVLINAVIECLKLKDAFQVIQSAESEAYGKPHPAVFISCAKALEVRPEECLVFEDSLNGVIAGKAARMTVVAVPEKGKTVHKGFAVADLSLNSLLDFNEETWRGVSS